MRGEQAFNRYAKVTDGPLTFLALLMIPLLLAPFLFRLDSQAESVVLGLDWVIWALFSLDYGIRLYLTPNRARFFRTHLVDLVIVIVPFLRPLRVLRSVRVLRALRLLRLAAFAFRFVQQARAIMRKRGLNYILLVVFGVVLVCAAAVVEFEKRVEGSNIDSFPDALWWAATTITTVGYGDRFPVTPMGRGVGVFLMVSGIALFGVLTAAIAAFFVETDKQVDDPGQVLRDIADRLERIERKLNNE